MTVILTGGTGLVGQALGQKLASQGYKIHLLARRAGGASYPHKLFLWPDATAFPPQEAFPKEGDYGVIHLAGEPVFQWPWTKKIKETIYLSRVEGAKQLVSALNVWTHLPSFFLSASAIGAYGDQGDQTLTEDSFAPDQNLFLQKVCWKWEKEALKASGLCRTLVFRLGHVMSRKKGFLHEQIKWLKRGFLPRLFSQKPFWLSWIALEDLISLILWAIESTPAKGIYNAVSPQPVLLKDFYSLLAKEYRGFKIPAPLFLLKLAGGEMARNLLLSSKALPDKALAQGFAFQYPALEKALKIGS